MLVKKADDYQSWYIEEDNFGILVDPWLDKKMNPHSSFFLQRTRDISHSLNEEELSKVKAIIITAPFADHLHIPTLKFLGPDITIFSMGNVKKILSKSSLKKFHELHNYKIRAKTSHKSKII